MIEQLHEGFGRAIEDGDFNVVDINEDVVDAAGIGSRQKVLGGGEQDALLHQAGGIAHASDIVAMGFDGKVLEIHAAENDARIGGSGKEAQVGVNPGVKADALGFDGAMDGALKHKKI